MQEPDIEHNGNKTELKNYILPIRLLKKTFGWRRHVRRTKMKLKIKIFIAGVLIVVVAVAVIAFGAYRTFSNQGEKAISLMSESELALLGKVSLIQKGMSYNEVAEILGEPDREAIGLRPTWRINNSPFNQIAVYFGNEGAFKIRWFNLGCFIYEPTL